MTLAQELCKVRHYSEKNVQIGLVDSQELLIFTAVITLPDRLTNVVTEELLSFQIIIIMTLCNEIPMGFETIFPTQ